MEQARSRAPVRRPYLLCGVGCMPFAGILYAWSILKAPLAEAFIRSVSQLALNFIPTMRFFCARPGSVWPPISSAFVSVFYGTKHFAMNFSIANTMLIPTSFTATLAGPW